MIRNQPAKLRVKLTSDQQPLAGGRGNSRTYPCFLLSV